ncbi:MAG: hypothetical protein A2Y33_05800 [Spirochaetes bacterium GWF1_51_8]|nr:MAG: hypothetical protein A2Y33_05800 [Spirochaetes bacterium GWF1_51_8]
MCPLKENCSFYRLNQSAKLSTNEVGLMKKVFCDSELFLLNKDCRIFQYRMHRKTSRPRPMHMNPLG